MAATFQEDPVTVVSGGRQLIGMVHRPADPARGAVVFCHGFTGNKLENKRLFVEAARDFAAHGFWSLRFDFFGSGDSEGEFHESRLSINIRNLKDVLFWANARAPQPVFVLGISMGAATAVLTLAHEKVPEVAGLVLWSTVPDFRTLFEAKVGMPLEKFPPLEQYEYDGWLIDREFYTEAVEYDVKRALAELRLPKLIVQGGADEPVFTQGFEDFKRIAPPPVKFHRIEGAGHTFQTVAHRREVIAYSRNWLISQLGKGEGSQ